MISLLGLGSTHHHHQQQQKNVLWKQLSPQEKSSQFLTVSILLWARKLSAQQTVPREIQDCGLLSLLKDKVTVKSFLKFYPEVKVNQTFILKGQQMLTSQWHCLKNIHKIMRKSGCVKCYNT